MSKRGKTLAAIIGHDVLFKDGDDGLVIENLMQAWLDRDCPLEEVLRQAFALFAGDLDRWDEFVDLVFRRKWTKNEHGDWKSKDGEWVWRDGTVSFMKYQERLVTAQRYEIYEQTWREDEEREERSRWINAD